MKHPPLVHALVLSPLLVALASMACSGMDSAPSPTTAATPDGGTSHEPGVAAVPSAPPGTAPPITPIPKATVWSRESVHPIRWSMPVGVGALDPTVTVEQSIDGGPWTELEEVATDELYVRWTIPAAGSKGKIAVIFHRTDLTAGVIVPIRRLETDEVTFGPSQKRTYAWTMVNGNAPFGPRDGAGGIVYGGRMWLIGGWNPERFPRDTANDVWSSADGVTWVQEKPNTYLVPAPTPFTKADWEGRHFGGYHAYAGKMWIVGGDANQGYYLNDIWSSTDGRAWTRTDIHATVPRVDPRDGSMFPPEVFRWNEIPQYGLRTASVSGVFNGKLLLAGGQCASIFVDPTWPGATPTAFNDVWSSADGASFTQVATVGPTWKPRGFVSELVSHQGRVWMVGGGLHDDPSGGLPNRIYYNDVWSSPDGASWVPSTNEAPFAPRIWHNVKEFDGRIWVINGYDGDTPGQGRLAGNLSDVWYSSDGENWYPASPPNTYVPRHAQTAWVHAGALFVGSGNEIDERWHADVWRMSPVP